MNPFKYGQVVLKEEFCARPGLEKTLRGYILSSQNVVMEGERRCGKTSLLQELARKMSKVQFLYVDLAEIKSIDELCRRIIRAMATMEQKRSAWEKVFKSVAHLRPSMTFDPITGSTSVSISANNELKPDTVEGLMDLIESMSQPRKMAVVFDEFQAILKLKYAQEALALMRSKIQFHSNICYIFAGSVRNSMYTIFNMHKSPFFKSALPIEVGPLKREVFENFLRKQFDKGKRQIKPELFSRIFELTANIPGDVQQLCSAIWEASSYKDSIGEEILPESLKLIFSRELRGYSYCMSQITELQARCLRGLARLGGKSPFSIEFLQESNVRLPGSVKTALKRLTELEIIYRYQGEYKFINPFFKHWLVYKDI